MSSICSVFRVKPANGKGRRVHLANAVVKWRNHIFRISAASRKTSKMPFHRVSGNLGFARGFCFQVLVREARTPCLRQFTKGLGAPSFSLFERIFAIRRISVAKSRKPVEIACRFSVLALSGLEMQPPLNAISLCRRHGGGSGGGANDHRATPEGRALQDVSKEVVGIHDPLTRSLFGDRILSRLLLRASLAKSTFAPLRF